MTFGRACKVSARAQVDGPCHFTANTLRPLGPTLLKRRLIAASGWRVAVVPYYAWNQLCLGYERQLFIHLALQVRILSPPWAQAEPYRAFVQISGCKQSPAVLGNICPAPRRPCKM